jgi:uncharacterized protein (TIGR02271 family)
MQWDVREGMFVRTADGEKLGTVIRCGGDTFVVEKGLFLPRDYVLRYEDIADVRGGEVRLRLGREDVVSDPVSREATRREVVAMPSAFGEPQEVVVELAHEEAIPHTVIREQGQFRIRKVVRTEVRHFEVPVRREELVVERLPVEAGPLTRQEGEPELLEGARPFEEASFVITLREEQVEFTKTAKVWQEVRVSRATRLEERQVRTTVRRELADVEERGEVLHDGPVDGLHS